MEETKDVGKGYVFGHGVNYSTPLNSEWITLRFFDSSQFKSECWIKV